PHQKIELETYKSQIMEYFRSSPYDPSVAMRVDKEARQKAANTPFDLGNPESFHTQSSKPTEKCRHRAPTARRGSSSKDQSPDNMKSSFNRYNLAQLPERMSREIEESFSYITLE
ncbi:hypothetical protein EV360DRAFT_56997, partial [Lentinula raphanica]